MRRRQDDRMVVDRESRGYFASGLSGAYAGAAAALPMPVRHHRAPTPSPWHPRERAIGAARPAVHTKVVRMDHRQGARYRAFQLVDLQYDDTERKGALLYNVSRNGMFILTTAGLGINHCVDVLIPAAVGGAAVRVSALVVHGSECGLGLIFRDLDEAAAAAVEELCSWR